MSTEAQDGAAAPNPLKNVLDVSAFMSGIKSAIPPSRSSDDRIKLKKLYLNAETNQGTLSYIPYSGTEGFYHFFSRKDDGSGTVIDNRVKELKVWNDDYESFTWLKILPKHYYPGLTVEQSAKYDEVLALWQTCFDDDLLDNKQIRMRSYGLHYGMVLSHFNLNNQSVEDTVAGPTLIVAPSAAAPAAFDDGIAQKVIALGGNDWIPAVMNDNPMNRKGYVMLSFQKATAGFGYQVGYNIEFASEFSSVPPKDFECTGEELGLFKSLVKDFMGWQNGEDGSMFSEQVFNDAMMNLRAAVGEEYIPPVVADAPPVSTPAQTEVPQDGHMDNGSVLGQSPAAPVQTEVQAPPPMPSSGGIGSAPPPPTPPQS